MTSEGGGRRHPEEGVLHGYAEGGLEREAAARVRGHLEGCDRCRREVEAVGELLRRTADLPRGIEPPRDLWPGVEARIRGAGRAGEDPVPLPRSGDRPDPGRDGGREGGAATRGSGLREAAPWLAAAAALLVAVTAGATLWLAAGPDDAADGDAGDAASSAVPGPARAGAPLPVGLEGVRAGYRPLVERLTAVMETRGHRLPPETREVVERNLGIIDAAIAEAESALARHPASPDLIRALDRSYQRKIDLLRRSARLTAQM